ncbi:MAG: alpha/beta fold hydrolase [Methyloceanibacter sp.]|uniref:alpha/beta fold hydrolase n=1 Tax=Methyloceanibacter sp. TaxID=1965321 RepID=UPI003D6D30C3
MKHLSVGGVEIAYFDEGKGPCVMLGHCSSASHKEWLPLIEDLKGDWRVLAPDLIGYGQSDPWPIDKPFSIAADVDVLLALAKKTRGPLHFVGHSYGAALALEAARKLGKRVKSLTLVEPVAFHLLRIDDRPEWKEVEQLGLAVLDPVAKGDDRKAAAAFMSYWLGRWRWWLSPERFKNAIAATIPKVALEFSIALDAQTTLSDYAEIAAPTLLIVGAKTRAPARAVIELLGGTLPNAKVETLKGAGHMSPFTHPAELNRMILDHLAAHR